MRWTSADPGERGAACWLLPVVAHPVKSIASASQEEICDRRRCRRV